MSQFEFFVGHETEGHHNYSTGKTTPPREDHWLVGLPHQCDSWMIASDSYDYTSHEDAVAKLKQFIQEAQDALAALERRETIGTWY
jgi:hypothetical protein